MPCCVSGAGAGHRWEAEHGLSVVMWCLHCQLALRMRGVQFEAFRPFLWHLMAALKPLPDQVNCYRYTLPSIIVAYA